MAYLEVQPTVWVGHLKVATLGVQKSERDA
jgi:hypothetical protein